MKRDSKGTFYSRCAHFFPPHTKTIALHQREKYHAMVLNPILFSHDPQYSKNGKHSVGGKNERSARSTVCTACASLSEDVNLRPTLMFQLWGFFGAKTDDATSWSVNKSLAHLRALAHVKSKVLVQPVEASANRCCSRWFTQEMLINLAVELNRL